MAKLYMGDQEYDVSDITFTCSDCLGLDKTTKENKMTPEDKIRRNKEQDRRNELTMIYLDIDLMRERVKEMRLKNEKMRLENEIRCEKLRLVRDGKIIPAGFH